MNPKTDLLFKTIDDNYCEDDMNHQMVDRTNKDPTTIDQKERTREEEELTNGHVTDTISVTVAP